MNEQRKKIHPHKFTLWVALGSIVMMFAGLTSAYIVKRDAPGWTTFSIPRAFWYSTGVMLLSSVTVQMALKAFKEREMMRYRNLITLTAFLGVAFVGLQWIGFKSIWNSGITLKGSGGGQFLYIIAGLHALHVLGGIVALIILFIKAFASKVRRYDSIPIELMSTYWHFVDLLWIYLFIFFMGIK
ncbi:cytochrome c oxidase subunit 3 [Flavitalea sp. BT771]|uniref:cytochrome c oxidase subunit 3 n=1 Tax=Flavitalea sp. BT771 TaxID=3063329 RepID=UPI0026E4492D|nr:cytochrome c oxidase subunit 3 [Flavitalea sp. BT771]MDO6434400.1 cytochrome c oxidase subunit 3 [Flavitalea sp. BT771]MDV6223300.1 cytochrome c oxidase subunit 3 [Flavitalea sp. BT771]